MTTPFLWNRGASLPFALKVVDGQMTGNEPVRCALKKAIGAEPVGEELLEFAYSFSPASDDAFDRMAFLGTPEQSLGLEPGQYLADARIVYAEQVVITRTIPIILKETVTTE